MSVRKTKIIHNSRFKSVHRRLIWCPQDGLHVFKGRKGHKLSKNRRKKKKETFTQQQLFFQKIRRECYLPTEWPLQVTDLDILRKHPEFDVKPIMVFGRENKGKTTLAFCIKPMWKSLENLSICSTPQTTLMSSNRSLLYCQDFWLLLSQMWQVWHEGMTQMWCLFLLYV